MYLGRPGEGSEKGTNLRGACVGLSTEEAVEKQPKLVGILKGKQDQETPQAPAAGVTDFLSTWDY